MKSLSTLILALVVVVLISQPAMALSFTGSLSSPSGITASPGTPWDGTISLTWIVTQNIDMSWDYQYRFSYPSKDISHFIVAISPNATANDFWGANGSPITIATYDPSNPGNPGLPSAFYGLKLDYEGNYFTFTSTKAPVWGDFYIKDGKFDGNDVYAYNSSFGSPDPTDAPRDGTINNKILRPDSVTTTIPEPSSMILFGSVLAFAGGIRRFRRK
ncbi:MAG: PEP-CTERM sorting domain-containing protein [FCB group bacterium]|nr:PEP-CTERM sorting domain-containing protein [FCB group bacterium]